MLIASAILIAIIMVLPITRGPRPGPKGQRPGLWAGALGPDRGQGPGGRASKALWLRPKTTGKEQLGPHAVAIWVMDGLSDELLRIVVKFAPDERLAWAKTKKAWFCRLLRHKETDMIVRIFIVLDLPGMTAGFFSQLRARLNTLRYGFAEQIG